MGVCAHRKDREDWDASGLPEPVRGVLQAQVLQRLIDIRKSNHVPVLSLAGNLLYLKRVEMRMQEAGPCKALSLTKSLETSAVQPISV